jgi:eukaryotic-like serine/threonine-protein kinase
MYSSSSKACPECTRRFGADVASCPHDGTLLDAIVDAELEPGSLIDERYRIERPLGKGGMGMVYLAEDTWLDRPCALKVLNARALADAHAVARFHREAKSVSQISDPHVVTVSSFHETPAGLAYLAMEYVKGDTLARRLADEILIEPAAAVRIVSQTAQALRAAHERGIVHRDLKPGNIMLTRDGNGRESVKVVDFGLAKPTGGAGASGITTVTSIMGTPDYMSPEQWFSPHVDHRSDIFSLGLIAAQMLTGALPPGRPLAATGREILELVPTDDWPEDLRRVVERALAFAPRERYASAMDFARAFADAVGRWQGADLRLTDPDSELPRTRHVAPARPVAAPARLRYGAGALVAAGLLGSGLWYSTRDAVRATDAPGVIAPIDSAAPTQAAEPPDETANDEALPVAPPPAATSAARDSAPAGEAAAGASAETDLGVEVELAAALRRLEALIDLADPDADSIRVAQALATTLLERTLPDSIRLEAAYRLAETRLFLGERVAACDGLRAIAGDRGDVSRFVRAADLLLRSSCGPDPARVP